MSVGLGGRNLRCSSSFIICTSSQYSDGHRRVRVISDLGRQLLKEAQTSDGALHFITPREVMLHG